MTDVAVTNTNGILQPAVKSTLGPKGIVQASNANIEHGSLVGAGGQQTSPGNQVETIATSLEGSGSNTPLRVVGVLGPKIGSPLVADATLNKAGMAFYVDASGVARPASSGTLAHASAIGVTTTQPIAQVIPDRDTGRGAIDYAVLAVVELSAAVWNAVTGGSTGLVTGATYYVDGTTAGHLSTSAPGSGFSTKIGVALSPTQLLVNPAPPTSVGG